MNILEFALVDLSPARERPTMCDIEHELRSYTDTTDPPADQDAMAELVADLASEAHAATMAEPVEQMITTDDDSNTIPF